MAVEGPVEVAPLRSREDFINGAQFTVPTLHDRPKDRMINNLIYYQTNYFPYAIMIFILVGILYPKDLIIVAATLVSTFVFAKLNSQYPSLVPIAAIAVAVLFIYALGSILAFFLGITMPLAGILLHAATRKRNMNTGRIANILDMLTTQDVTPMTIILAKICTTENEQQESGMHWNSENTGN